MKRISVSAQRIRQGQHSCSHHLLNQDHIKQDKSDFVSVAATSELIPR